MYNFVVLTQGVRLHIGSSVLQVLILIMCLLHYVYRILVGKPGGKRPLGRTRRRWVDNIKMDLREIEWDGMD
jgi:hypothetical protein